MQCPYCGGDSQVLDSRGAPDGIRRRRTCNECRRRFTTYEKLSAPNIKVTKRSGAVEPFTPDKIVRLLNRVCRDRPISPTDIVRHVRALEAGLLDEGAKTVDSVEIVTRILNLLFDVDKLSYDRLAANYIDENGSLRLGKQSVSSQPAKQLELFTDES